MIEDIGGITSKLVSLALDVASQRQQVIANNIANAQTANFAPQRVRFETLLDDVLTHSVQPNDEEPMAERLGRIRERLQAGELIEASGDNEVKLDLEMARLAENVLRYRALLEGMSKRGSVIKLAITEGK
ncbi:MAG TPA: flagellar basal body rod protein FlgB [Gammaproteobacteria bacterium]|nr:flagellar basal body rod protein FlgB [Gammaproteobacteria bacterium]